MVELHKKQNCLDSGSIVVLDKFLSDCSCIEQHCASMMQHKTLRQWSGRRLESSGLFAKPRGSCCHASKSKAKRMYAHLQRV
jgi:hypothetical protein